MLWPPLLFSSFFFQTTSPTGQGRSDSPVYTNLQELKISQSSLPPVPSGSPLHILGDWETHKDLSGRHFYYNRATGERTWKPPRTRDASGSTSSIRGDSQGTAESEVRAAKASWRSSCESTWLWLFKSLSVGNMRETNILLQQKQLFHKPTVGVITWIFSLHVREKCQLKPLKQCDGLSSSLC